MNPIAACTRANVRREMITGGVWAGTMLAASLVVAVLRRQGYVDGDTAVRAVTAMNGLLMVWYGNRMPKTFVRGEQARRARRVAAWSMVLSGAVYAGLWAFAPRDVAVYGGMGAVLAGMAVTFGYCLSLRSKARTPAA